MLYLLHHSEVLKIGAAFADGLQARTREEGRDIVGGDAPLGTERIAAFHLVRREESDVSFQSFNGNCVGAAIDRRLRTG